MIKPLGKVAVFLGGRSRERVISLKSGQAVACALREAGLDVVTIDTANGFRSELKRTPIDIAFLALHGLGGEDGTIQGILNEEHVSYVGSDPEASALAFDKARSKELFERSGIPTPPFDVITRSNWKKILELWKPPYVVKPVNEGSSIGIFFVEGARGALRRIEFHLKRYGRLLIEEKIDGREFTVGILGEEALPVIELRPKRPFYDYRAKYTKGMTEYLVPAPIPAATAKKFQKMALTVHQILGLRDFSRVDMMTDAAGRRYILEANSIPGFTELSLLPKAAKAAGISFDALCYELAHSAWRRKINAKKKKV